MTTGSAVTTVLPPDRAAALAVSEVAPEAQLLAVEDSKFLHGAVRYLAAEAATSC
jgi:hypothetical protein